MQIEVVLYLLTVLLVGCVLYVPSVGLPLDCQVFGWGSNSHHQVGLPYGGAHIAKPEHIELPYGVPVVQVVAGGRHSLALTVSGCLYSWGKNKLATSCKYEHAIILKACIFVYSFGQLGVGDDTGKDLGQCLCCLFDDFVC